MPKGLPDIGEGLTPTPALTIIVPLLNERAGLPGLCRQLAKQDAEQSIIVDGGSDDGSWQWLQTNWQDGKKCLALRGDCGRAQQMNIGAARCDTDMLLFLHADSKLPVNACALIRKAITGGALWGRFDVQIESSRYAMKVIAWFINLRSRLTGVATGDQAIFVSSNAFQRVGGYDLIPLMEDIALSRKLKRLGQPACLPDKVLTSARRWEEGGVTKTVLLMWYLRLAYYLGVTPQRLARHYRHVR